MSPRLRVLSCDAAGSLQDGGRVGFARYGLSASGPMDRLAHATANALVGNPHDAAIIEFGLSGANLRIEGGAARIALAGAPCALRVDGEPVADHRSHTLADGSEVRIDRPRAGVFSYLAVGGGFALAPAMGSLSLHQRAELGGFNGRVIRPGDALPLQSDDTAGRPDTMVDPMLLDHDEPIQVVLGPQHTHFTSEGLAVFLGSVFHVSNRADRMGYQLDGPAIAHGPGGFNIVSDATVSGSIQVPGSGRPIVLLADRQTTGGYPKIATVISADLRRVAQRRPGQGLRFVAIGIDEAVRLARAQAALMADLPNRLRPVANATDLLLAANLAGEAVDAFAGDG